MMRQPIFAAAILVLLLCMLLSVAGASAECAWVLWWTLGVAEGAGPSQPSAKGAYERKQECESAMQRELTQHEQNIWKNDDPKNPGYRTTRGDNYIFTSKGRWWLRNEYLCLPDTVDPRAK